MNQAPVEVDLCGDRFSVVYRIAGNEGDARQIAEGITIEQTVEFPADLLPPGDIPDRIVGRIEDFESLSEQTHLAEISYAVETSGYELNQLLNVVIGNSSIKPGIRVERLDLCTSLLNSFRGPRFGRQGLRDYLNVYDRPLLSTALKPMGLCADDIAGLAYQFALGGIDIIKDDHGLTDQPYCPFRERVERTVEAVEKANAQTGQRAVYMPNVTGPMDRLLENAHTARELGAGALLVSPGLTGFDAMRVLADDDALALPIMSHPAFLGSYVTSPSNGISHYALFGQIMRLAGADAAVYPNFGGRFSFSRDECQEIIDGSMVEMGSLKPLFPAPGGGMSLDSIDEMAAVYGQEVIYLIGGNLHRHGDDLVATARKFRQMVEQ
jgi:ribulose-bisphosphate carboxylase large chain